MHDSYLRARSYALIGLIVVLIGFFGFANTAVPDFCYPLAFACILLGPVFSIVAVLFAPRSIQFNRVGGLVWLFSSLFALGLGVHSIHRLFLGPHN